MRTDRSAHYFPLIEKFKSLPAKSKTVERYCWQHSINTKTFYYWKKRYEAREEKGSVTGTQGFLPVVIGAPSKTEGGITIEYADGTRLIFKQDVSSGFIKEMLPAFSQ
jgi:hypothetical protein